ncbi:hypothetical protein PRK78_003582 [Emydomyces testavorans]|uniref:Cytomegalovirus gH-receptor family protein n=1 Tax=Emydomyces testavorans TaxID=2070801 RepID=A0AAF0DJG2_9EURO|nr:hypothetical protein PRK78_003582 [Emydomyces testavorans]
MAASSQSFSHLETDNTSSPPDPSEPDAEQATLTPIGYCNCNKSNGIHETGAPPLTVAECSLQRVNGDSRTGQTKSFTSSAGLDGIEGTESGGMKGTKHELRGLNAEQGAVVVAEEGDKHEHGGAKQQQRAPTQMSGRESLTGRIQSDQEEKRHSNGLGIKTGSVDFRGMGMIDGEHVPIFSAIGEERGESPHLNEDKPQSISSAGASSFLDSTAELRGRSAKHSRENTTDKGTPTPLERTAVQIGNSSAADTKTITSPKHHHRERVTSLSPHPRKDQTLKLSPAKIHELISAPDSLCLHIVPTDLDCGASRTTSAAEEALPQGSCVEVDDDDQFNAGRNDIDMGLAVNGMTGVPDGRGRKEKGSLLRRKSGTLKHSYLEQLSEPSGKSSQKHRSTGRQRSQTARIGSTPGGSSRRLRSPFESDRQTSPRTSRTRADGRIPGRLNVKDAVKLGQSSAELLSPVPASIPLPPFSIPTYLQLELSSDRPSALYIHQSRTKDFPYESSRVKLERLQNFLLLPPSLEQVLCFGTLACLDSWLYSFTILPLRFCKSISILLQSRTVNLGLEVRYISSFIVQGLGRVWRRRQRSRSVGERRNSEQNANDFGRVQEAPLNISSSVVDNPFSDQDFKSRGNDNQRRSHRHRRKKSVPSGLQPDDKADILNGLLMISTCIILLYFDASRMYHWIRGQAAIKLYVIYNVLEVGDRLLSAIGQDVLECLFSREALERKPDGRSKVLRPFWLFILALIYTVIHATALFYQVMTLNVAVNSYSNALITLLLSNQFVEIKSTVFKKFEKENLFQLTCADVVERFQLWLMLMIIASRNFVETGAITFGNALAPFSRSTPSPSTNSTPPSHPASSILPRSFTLFPSSVFSSLSSVNSFLPTVGHVLGPFLVVLGSEMLVDWLKHAYVNKFNNIRPSIYGRFLDILTKDYYTNAFADQNLNRRLGLPIIPLSCLFFRVSIQTYQMFLTAWLPQPPSLTTPSNTTSLTSIHNHYSSSTTSTATLSSSFPLPTTLGQISSIFHTLISHTMPSPTAFIPIFTIILLLLLYVTLLLVKLVLGMALLSYSRARYKQMKLRERELVHQQQQQQQQQHQKQAHAAQAVSTSDPQLPSPPPDSATPLFAVGGSAKTKTAGDAVEGARRVGGWGAVEVGEERRRWIYADDPEALRRLKEREERDGSNKTGKSGGGGLHGIENVRRYEMVAKRIW